MRAALASVNNVLGPALRVGGLMDGVVLRPLFQQQSWSTVLSQIISTPAGGGGPPAALIQLSAALASLNATAEAFSYAAMQQYAMTTAVMNRGT